MVEKILEDNIDKFDNKLLEYTIQLKTLNFLKNNKKIEDDFFKKVKYAIDKAYLDKVGTFE